MQRETLDRLIEILRSARDRKRMYFMPVGPIVVNHWIHGLHIGCSLVGLEWSLQYRQLAVERRALTFSARGATHEREQRGLASEEIVDELLSIEIEMWEAHRDH